MLGYIPLLYFYPQGNITASQALGKATGRLLLWVGFKTSLSRGCGPKNQLFPRCCGEGSEGGSSWQFGKQYPFSACPARSAQGWELQSRAAPSFPRASPQNLHLLLQASWSITTQRAEPAASGGEGVTGSHKGRHRAQGTAVNSIPSSEQPAPRWGRRATPESPGRL